MKSPKFKVQSSKQISNRSSKKVFEWRKTAAQSGGKASKKDPQTMEELLKMEEARVRPLKRGDQVKAKILKISRREIVCDISGKSYGIVVGRQFELVRDLVSHFRVGDEIKARVIIPEMEGGETLVSFRESASDKLWENLSEAKKKNEELQITVLKVISEGLLVDCQGLRGFIPRTQIDPEFAEKPEKLMGRSFKVKVLEVDQKQNRLVLSQKEVTQKEELRAKRQAILSCSLGEVLSGEVVGVEKYNLQVEVFKNKSRIDGLVHISEISWARIEDLAKLYKAGDKVKGKVIGLDEQGARIELSLKQLTPDPWAKVAKKYPKEKTVKGKVVKVTAGLGVFVELEKGVEGLLHISKIAADKEFEVEEKISVVIEKVDLENRRISLSYVPTKKPIGYR